MLARSGNRCAKRCMAVVSRMNPENCAPFSARKALISRKPTPMFLNMEQKIAALVDREKIGPLRNGFQHRIVAGDDVLPAEPDAVRRGVIAACSDQRACCDDILARQFAVKPHLHDAARAQPRQQQSPACHGIREVMQHAGRIDEIKRLAHRTKLRDVGVRELDVGDAKLLRHALGVAEAREAQIDRENARLRRLLCQLDGGKTGTAAGNQHIVRESRMSIRTELLRCSGGAIFTQRG